MRTAAPLIMYEDPGHGWLRVDSRAYPDAFAFGTGYGYRSRDGRFAYLEEDCELSLFLDAHPELRETVQGMAARYHDDNRIRGLPSIGVGTAGAAYLQRGK